MSIAYCVFELYLPHVQSLKEKRTIVKRAQARLRRFNVSVAEIGYQDLWQRSQLGAVSIGSDRQVLEKMVAQFIREMEKGLDGHLVDYQVEFLE
ncbi:MAG: DUF503 domain-containing protein [Acidobacteria bacterium]|nr:DUF503 domain-containing protein [Acidobacteriota bacterium]